MSSSDARGLGYHTGRVIMGIGAAGPQESTVAEIEARRSPMHFEQVEAEFWARVRGRAKDKAREILEKAMGEGEAIKARAHAEGYDQGMRAAGEEFESQISAMSQAMSETLAAIQAERKSLWACYRTDLATLVRLAVEKTLGVMLDVKRSEILGALLDESLDLIDGRTDLVVSVNPEDAELLGDLLDRAKTQRPGLDRWRIVGDPSIAPGGVRLESREGMVDNTVGTRFAEVDALFSRLAVDVAGEDGHGA